VPLRETPQVDEVPCGTRPLLVDEILPTHFVVSDDIDRSCRFDTEMLGDLSWPSLALDMTIPSG
jgi:hypothetical protein